MALFNREGEHGPFKLARSAERVEAFSPQMRIRSDFNKPDARICMRAFLCFTYGWGGRINVSDVHASSHSDCYGMVQSS